MQLLILNMHAALQTQLSVHFESVTCTQVAPVSNEDLQDDLQLLQLPDTALSLVLQQLDPCSMACTAATCSKLSHAVPAAISKVAVRCKTLESLISCDRWLKHHSLANLVECSITNLSYEPINEIPVLDYLPCPHLRQLQLSHVRVQFEAAGGSPGLLHDCTGLTGLEVNVCRVQDQRAASGAITARGSSASVGRWLQTYKGSSTLQTCHTQKSSHTSS
jgi:hypothetical protein